MKVVYSPEQDAAFDRQVGHSSPSASKPEKVMADWKEHGIQKAKSHLFLRYT